MMDAFKTVKYAMCTLFDSNYLDKGLVLYESLEKCASNFTLYVLAMNDTCYDVLRDLNLRHLVPIKLTDFESEDLLKVKPSRSVGEYCWTCGSSLIKYVFETFNPDYCSYIDADMYFYDDPLILIKELEDNDADVSIVGHRFNRFEKDGWIIRGRYCVECNTFKNSDNAKYLLNIWINQCLDHCSLDGDGIHWGDQKYMDNWTSDYDFVIETKNMGAGVAPWNIAQYKLSSKNPIVLSSPKGLCRLLFYHFENITYYSANCANINVYHNWFIDDNIVNLLYTDYLMRINEKKVYLLSKYQIDTFLKKHPGINTPLKPKSVFSVIKNVIHTPISLLLFNIIPSYIYKSRNNVTI